MRDIYLEARARSFNVTEADIAALLADESRQQQGEALHMKAANDRSYVLSEAKPYSRESRYTYVHENGVAVMNLIGPIFPRANLMTMSGGVSMQTFLKEFVMAYNDPNVAGIVIESDSPGGDVRKVPDSAKIIYELSKKGNKQVASYASGFMASGAYYIGSAVGPGNLYSSESAVLGSIGVLLQLSKPNDNTINVTAARSPNKRPDVTTEEGRSGFQQQVDDLMTLFERDVAKQRGVTVDTVFEKYGQGSTFAGIRARSLGMVDKIASMGDVVAMVGQDAPRTSANRKSFSLSNETLALISYTDEEIADMGLKDSITNMLGFNTKDEQNNDEAPETSISDGSEGQEAEATVQQIVVQSLTDKDRATLETEFEALATSEVNNLVLQSKLLPAEAPQAICELIAARVDDAMYGGSDVLFINEEGQAVTGTREEAAMARLKSRKPHTLTQKAIASVKNGDGSKNIKATVLAESEDDTSVEATVMSAERREQLLKASGQGQSVLAREQKAQA